MTMSLCARLETTPGSRRELAQALVDWAAVVRRSPGLVEASVCEDVEADAAFEVRSKWQTPAALEDHVGSDAFGVLVGAAGVLAVSVCMSVARVEEELGLPDIHKRREARRAPAPRRKEE